MSLMSQGSPIYVTVDTHQFEIPFEAWWLEPNSTPCIQRTPEGFEGVLLGDVLFRVSAVAWDVWGSCSVESWRLRVVLGCCWFWPGSACGDRRSCSDML
eukprot:1870771-Rhodomonas_salina.1